MAETTPEPLHRRLRAARRARGLTQAELARQAGCQQSAVSMLENGRPEVVARDTLVRLAGLLGVAVEAEQPTVAAARPAAGRAFCPQAVCPSNVPYVVAGELLFWPRPQAAAIGGGSRARHCAYCGEVLAFVCPGCGAAAGEGACCRECGQALVPPPAEFDGPIERWAESRRQALAEWRALVVSVA